MSEYTSEQLSRAVAEKLGYEPLSYFKMHGMAYLFVRRPKGEPQLARSWADSVDMALSLSKAMGYPVIVSDKWSGYSNLPYGYGWDNDFAE